MTEAGSDVKGDRGVPRGAGAALFALSLALHAAAYGPFLDNGFTFDDTKIVVSGPEVNGSLPLSSAFARPYFPRAQDATGVAYRPVTLVSLGLDVRLFGLSPRAIHAANVLWAALGTSLLALAWAAVGGGLPAASAGVVLASLHPVRSEAVLSAVGRSELLALAFAAGALLLARRSLREGRALPGALSGLLLLLALGSKESAFAAPLLLALLLALDPSTRAGAAQGWVLRLRPLLPVALSWSLAFAIAFAARHAVLGGFLTGPAAVVDPMDNPLAPLGVRGRVVGAAALLPLAATRLGAPATLAADYGSNALEEVLARPLPWALSGAVALAGLVLLSCLLARRQPPVALALLWAVSAYLPFANILFPTGVVFAERILFLPSTCFALAGGGAVAAMAAAARASGPALRRAGPTAAGLLLVLLGVAGFLRIVRRAPEWVDDRALFSAVARDLPGNGRAFFNLGLLSLSEGNAPRARAELAAALAADSRFRPRVALLLDHANRLGRPDLAAAIRAALGP